MTQTQPYFTTVPASGTITLPSRYWDTEVMVLETALKKPLSVHCDESWRKKSLDEIIARQGGPKICKNPERLWEDFPKLWDSEEELEEFLERRKY